MNYGKWCALRRAAAWLVLAMFVCGLGWGARRASAATNVAVFNFQMTSETPDWKWLEKGLADCIATDFVQDRTLSVVARDEMQLLAATLHWVPEMATTDAKGMGQIKTQLKVETLVTGVYRVEGDRITITGQIIDVATRRETARREAAGKADQVLDLQRQLSAELMGVVLNKPAAQILPTLPVWTRSLPAAKALYEGMDLYDQGRYAEGWLKFRQASREDPQYMEAQYFVGKMYYFMDRYEHARRSLEKFVYLDMAHPRVGDAIVEYVHTYEASGASPDALLRLYENLARRLPNANVWQGREWGFFGQLRSEDWFRYKRMHVFTQVGRNQEVLDMTGPVLISHDWLPMPVRGCAKSFGVVNLMEHHARTGEIPTFLIFNPEMVVGAVTKTLTAEGGKAWVVFDAQGSPQTVPIQPRRLTGKERGASDRETVFDEPSATLALGLRVPSGYVFQALQFQALAEGDDGYLEIRLRRPDTFGPMNQCLPPQRADLREACRQGIRLESPPRLGILVAECRFGANGPQGGPIHVKGLTVKPTLARVQGAAVLNVACQSTADFRVYVDGALARWYPGRVGPLSPGTHTVRFEPVAPGTPYGEWSTTITVKAGDTLPLIGRLPWADQDRWGKWQSVLVGTAYPAPCPSLWRASGERPALQADEEAIRLVWSLRGDLWSSVSTDGERFSPPCKLDLPVSSGWKEYAPHLVRDESGRFVLAFLSDRDPRHRNLPYICWSRDFVHWSNPALVLDETVSHLYSLLHDDRGRLILDYDAKERRLLVSADGVQWKSEKMPGSVLAQDRTGLFCAYSVSSAKKDAADGAETRSRYTVSRWTSGDLHRWSSQETLGTFESEGGFPPNRLFVLEGEKGPVLLGFSEGGYDNGYFCEVGLCEPDSTGQWQAAGRIWGLLPGPASAARHPRWGSVIAALGPEGHQWWPREPGGLYLLRGPDLTALREYRNPQPPPVVRETPSKTRPKMSSLVGGTLGSVLTGKPFSEEDAPTPRVAKQPVGVLTYVPAFWRGGKTLQGSQHFLPPSPGSGTVHPRAKVVFLDLGGNRLALALDADTAGAAHYEVVRLDPTGKGDFKNALRVPRTYLDSAGAGSREPSKFVYQFAGDLAPITFGRCQPAPGVILEYEEQAEMGSAASLKYEFSTCAVGECQFGDKVYRVRLQDATHNLSVRDAARPRWDGQRLAGDCWGDLIWVDCHDDGGKVPWFTNMRGDPIEYDGRLWRVNKERAPLARYGNLILVDGRWWMVHVSEDGRNVTAEPYAGTLAQVRLDHPFWHMLLVSETALLHVYGGQGPVPVPAGQYRIYYYHESTAAAPNLKSPKLEISQDRSPPPGDTSLSLPAGATVPVRLGSPLRGTLVVAQKDGALHFDVELRDVAGRPIYSERLQEDKVRSNTAIRITLTGAVDRRKIAFDSTLHEASARGWKIPPAFMGTYTVSVEFPDTFAVEVAPVTVTVR